MKPVVAAVLIIGMFSVSAGAATPHITSVTGTVEQGGSIVINGSDFGTKSSGAPLLYDTIDNIAAYDQFNLINGSTVPVRSDGNCADCPWDTRIPTTWGNAPKYFSKADSTRVPGRPLYKVSKKGYFRGPDPFADLDENSEVYVSWWCWSNHLLYSGTGGAVFNKLMRYTAGNSSTEWEEQIEVESQNSYLTKDNCGQTGWDWMGSYPEFSANTWNHIELYIRGGGNLAAGTGSVRVFVNGRQISSSNTLYSCYGMLDHIYVWGSDPHVSNYYPANSKILFGELYLDTTLTRVVASSSANYQWNNAANTAWEIQPTTAWRDDQVQVDFNQGNFAPGSTVYLYVINAAGEISPGVSVTVGGTATAPGQPGQPQRIQ
ncbi:MAG: hypothetical protein IPM94_07035 [bacterium]|nr:hypothetical protein [bacterium]